MAYGLSDCDQYMVLDWLTDGGELWWNQTVLRSSASIEYGYTLLHNSWKRYTQRIRVIGPMDHGTVVSPECMLHFWKQ